MGGKREGIGHVTGTTTLYSYPFAHSWKGSVKEMHEKTVNVVPMRYSPLFFNSNDKVPILEPYLPSTAN